MSRSNNKVFLTGATGDIGSQILNTLQKANHPVRVLCRRQAQQDAFKARNVEASLGSLDDSVSSLAKLMAGCDTIFLNTAPNPNMDQQIKNAIDAAVDAGVRYIIKISASDKRTGTGTHWATSHCLMDEYLLNKAAATVGTGKDVVRWTLMSPSAFMGNLLSAKDPIKKGFLPQTAGSGRAAWVDSADIAAIGAQICLDGPNKHAGKEYFITGPALLNFHEIAAALSKTIGHKVRYIDLPPWIFAPLLRLGGMDEYMVSGLIAQFNEILRPDLEKVEVSNTMLELTGRPQTSITEWAEKHKKEFEGFDTGPYLLAALLGLLGVMGTLLYRSAWI